MDPALGECSCFLGLNGSGSLAPLSLMFPFRYWSLQHLRYAPSWTFDLEDCATELPDALGAPGCQHQKTSSGPPPRLRSEPGRAERPIKGDQLSAAKALFLKIVDGTATLDFRKMHHDTLPTTFGLNKNTETFSTERGRSPCFRLQTQGERQLVMASFDTVRAFMERSGMLQQVTPDPIQSYFKGMSKESIDQFLGNAGQLWHATIGPDDGIIIPFNFIFAEKVPVGD